MNIMKPVVISILITLGIFCGVLYTSCSKDGCKGVNCLNGCSCSGGQCAGPKLGKGIGGVNCEIIYRNTYDSSYKGLVNFAGKLDSVTTIDSNCFNHYLLFSPNTSDTLNYRTMTVQWQDSSRKLLVTLPITLTINGTSGSDFTVAPFVAGPFTYSGYGNISLVSASMYLTRTQGKSTISLSFNSFTGK